MSDDEHSDDTETNTDKLKLGVGRNMVKLAIYRMTLEAIPGGGADPVADAMAFLSDRERIMEAAKSAMEWARAAVQQVKSCPDNPYGNDDERIAAEILKMTDERMKKGMAESIKNVPLDAGG